MYGPLLEALRGVQWPSRRPVGGALPGTHQSRLRGSAPELSEYRPYRQGDDPRRLDWKLLARSDRAYIRLADDHSVLATTIVVDASTSMAFPPATLAKWRTACALAVGLAAVAHAGGDPVGLIVAAPEGMRHLPPRSRRDVIGEMARTLDAMTPGGSTPLAPALAAVRPRTRVAVVSDLLGDADALRRAAGELAAAGSEVHLVHVVADAELDPGGRAILATDPEDARVARPLVGDARREYTEAFAAWREALQRDWQGPGLSYALVTDGESVARAVRRLAGTARVRVEVGS